MKNLIQITVIFIGLSTFLFVACNKEPNAPSSIDDLIESHSFNESLTRWGASVSEIETEMKGCKQLSHSNSSLLVYDVLNGEMKIAFKFTEGELSSSCITAISEEDVFDSYVKGFDFLGAIDGTSIFQNEDNNIMAALWVDDYSLKVIGFTPITSNYFIEEDEPQEEIGQFIASGAADLGLSVKWAACNLGASSPEGYGDYYAWAECQVKDKYNWATYMWCNGTDEVITKYRTYNRNSVDLEPEDDAANVNLGGNWRMPTYVEICNIIRKCTWLPTSYKGISGYLATSKINGNSIFFPAAGYYKDSELVDGCVYWSASSVGYNWGYSLIVDDNKNMMADIYDQWRCYGCPIRPVTE